MKAVPLGVRLRYSDLVQRQEQARGRSRICGSGPSARKKCLVRNTR